MKRKPVVAALAVIAAAGLMLEAAAQVKPEILVKQRQAAMTLQGKYFGPLGGMAQGKAPYNADLVARNAAYLDVLTQMPWDGFAASTKDVKSAALPEVFTDPAKFKEAQERTQGEIARLVSISKSGDEAAIKAQILTVNKACDNCHESFREKR